MILENQRHKNVYLEGELHSMTQKVKRQDKEIISGQKELKQMREKLKKLKEREHEIKLTTHSKYMNSSAKKGSSMFSDNGLFNENVLSFFGEDSSTQIGKG